MRSHGFGPPTRLRNVPVPKTQVHPFGKISNVTFPVEKGALLSKIGTCDRDMF